MQPRDGSLVPAAMMNCAIWRAMLNVSRQRRYSTPWEYAGRAHFASGAPKATPSSWVRTAFRQSSQNWARTLTVDSGLASARLIMS